MRNKTVQFKLNFINFLQATELSNIGFECFGMIAKPNNNLCGQFGTQRGKEFLNGSNLYWEFLSQSTVRQLQKLLDKWATK